MKRSWRGHAGEQLMKRGESYLAVKGFCITIRYMGVKTSWERQRESQTRRNGRAYHMRAPALPR